MLNSEAKRQLVESVPFWWHTIDLGGGIKTPGYIKDDILDPGFTIWNRKEGRLALLKYAPEWAISAM